MNILFLSGWFPYPPDNGSKLRIYHLLRGLAQQHSVTLCCLTDGRESAEQLAHLRALGCELQLVRRQDDHPQSVRARFGVLSPTPRSLIATYSVAMERAIAHLRCAQHMDLIIASQLGTALYAQQFHPTPALFEEVEVGVLYQRYTQANSLRTRLRHGLTWAKHRRFVARLLPAFRACTVVSHEEKQLLAQVAPAYGAVHVAPNCVRVASYPRSRTPQADQLIFTGSFRYWPNYEAMQWFLTGVFPLIRARVPTATLLITGDQTGYPLPAVDGVHLTGFVEDVGSWLAKAWVSVAPLHSGGGTRLKILEAMAAGTPVVATSKGAEGLAVRHEEHLLIADTAEHFANAVVRVLRDQQLRQYLADNAYTKVRQLYDWDAAMPSFLQLVEQVAASKPCV